MTPKELVLTRYPKAQSRHPAAATGTLLTPTGAEQWGIYESDTAFAPPLGFGDTEEAAWNDAVAARLKAVCAYFTRGMHRRIGLVRGIKVTPSKKARLNAIMVFASLEDSRRLFGKEAEIPIRCRFSMGNETKNESTKKLDELAHESRDEHFLQMVLGAQPKLEEYILDFTFSIGTLDQLRGTEIIPGGHKFRLLLGAESETSDDVSKTLEDFPKLFYVNAPIRIMVYRGRSQKRAIEDMEAAFKRVLAKHEEFDRTNLAEWLFIGCPPYSNWYQQWEAPDGLRRQVYTLDPYAAEPVLVSKQDWWSWPAPAQPLAHTGP
jgi:hypothetical protein